MGATIEVDPVTSSYVTGRFRGASPSITAELWIDQVFESREPIDVTDPEPIEFRIGLPSFCFDGQEHLVEIRALNQVFPREFHSFYEGCVDPFANDLSTGWVMDRSRPNESVAVEFDLNGSQVGRAVANIYRSDFQRRYGFEFRFPQIGETTRSYIARVRIAGTDIDIQNSPVLSIARPRLVRAVQQLNFAFHYLEQRLMWDRGGAGPDANLTDEEKTTFARLLLEGSDTADLLEAQRRFFRPMQPQLTERYARRDYATLGHQYPGSLPRRIRGAHRDRPVDVIVPVYKGYIETKRCLESVFQSPVGVPYQIICVLDNQDVDQDVDQDDERLLRLLETYEKRDERFTLIRNETRQGFAGSVNAAMDLHHDRDVLILQSDCEVHGDWLGRLQRASYEGAGAGLVNPLTDTGEYLSYPSAGFPLPHDVPFEELDRIAKQANRHTTVQTPAAEGFCLYIRRGVLDDLGFFHNDQASGGYYAEKYFSVNAAALGWRSVVAADVFVKHHGFVSYATQDHGAVNKAREAFELWCPFYRDAVTDFLVDDATRPAKRELDLARLTVHAADRFCFVTHSGGGGTERHLADLNDALALDSLRALTIYSLPNRRVVVMTNELDSVMNLEYRLDREWAALVRDLKRLRVRHLHFHTSESLLFQLADELQLPYDITIHDFAWFCPRVNLINHSGVYCGEPPVQICNVCTGANVPQLIEESSQILRKARLVLCPSDDTRTRMASHFDLPNLIVREHPEWWVVPERKPATVTTDEPVTVAIIGRIANHKGLHVLRRCAAHAMEWNLPLNFVVVGETAGDSLMNGLTNVEITGPYREEQVDELIANTGAQVALLPSVWPETYSYTLSIAMRNGLHPVAFDLGAIAERLRATQSGTLLHLSASAAEINQSLLQAGRFPKRDRAAGGARYLNMLRDYYGVPHR